MVQNLASLVQTLRAANNPMAMLQQMAGQNPVYGKAFEMVKGKSEAEIMQIAENLAKTQNVDLNQLRQQLGI